MSAHPAPPPVGGGKPNPPAAPPPAAPPPAAPPASPPHAGPPPAAPPVVAPPPAAPEYRWLKEGMTTLIALVVTALTAWMLIGTYIATRSEPPNITAATVADDALYQENERRRVERKSGQKDILLLTLGLFGSVLGFYLGRVPAERRAEQAEAHARHAQATAENSVQNAAHSHHRANAADRARQDAERKVADAVQTTEQAMACLQKAVGGGDAGAGGAPRSALGGGAPAPGTLPDPTQAAVAHDALEGLLKRLR